MEFLALDGVAYGNDRVFVYYLFAITYHLGRI